MTPHFEYKGSWSGGDVFMHRLNNGLLVAFNLQSGETPKITGLTVPLKKEEIEEYLERN